MKSMMIPANKWCAGCLSNIPANEQFFAVAFKGKVHLFCNPEVRECYSYWNFKYVTADKKQLIRELQELENLRKAGL